jgi:glycosyltransferase involved in cell wall biosynthesis
VKLAFVFPPGLLNGRTLDFTDLLGSKRGTTGSEITALTFPCEMAARGHDVSLFVEKPNAPGYDISKPVSWTVRLEAYSALGDASDFDAVIMVPIMNDADRFRTIDPKCLRVYFQQMNDFKFCAPGFDAFIDLYISPSPAHLEHMMTLGGTTPSKWAVIGNGCYPQSYPDLGKTPGRCVHLSSPDRGLFHALDAWEEIHAAVPYAELRVFYSGLENFLEKNTDPRHRDRIAKIKRGLTLPGVTVRGGVSRDELAKELSEAELMLYPTDPVDFTEGFSCSTLEACAAGALPILMDADAMGQIYGKSCPTVAKGDLEEWTALVIRALTVPQWTEMWRKKAKALASTFAWPLLAEKLEKEIHARRKRT